jgi:hypothetical protein
MIRNVCAVVIGLIVGMAVNMAIGFLDSMLYPMPEGVDFSDTEGMEAYIATLPVLALLIIMVAHLGQAFVGGGVAALISRNHAMTVAMIVGILSLLAGVTNLLMMPLPAWMWIEIPLYLVASWAAATLVLKGRGAPRVQAG